MQRKAFIHALHTYWKVAKSWGIQVAKMSQYRILHLTIVAENLVLIFSMRLLPSQCGIVTLHMSFTKCLGCEWAGSLFHQSNELPMGSSEGKGKCELFFHSQVRFEEIPQSWLVNSCGRLQKWPQFTALFRTIPFAMQKWSLLSPPLESGWPCDFTWPPDCTTSDSMSCGAETRIACALLAPYPIVTWTHLS